MIYKGNHYFSGISFQNLSKHKTHFESSLAYLVSDSQSSFSLSVLLTIDQRFWLIEYLKFKGLIKMKGKFMVLIDPNAVL
jgi:hypothetical protein